MSRVAGVVLAAGASLRLGEPKQSVLLGDETLLERAVRVATEAGLEPLYVVTSAQQDVSKWVRRLSGCIVLVNEGAEEGMASSIRLGVSAADEAGAVGAVIMACDQPAVTPGHLTTLMSGGAEVLASAYAGRRGVPAYFPVAKFPQLMELRGDIGARELLRDAAGIDLPGGEVDVDTAQELAQARAIYSGRDSN